MKYRVMLTYEVEITGASVSMLELLDVVYRYGSPEESQYGVVTDETASFEEIQ